MTSKHRKECYSSSVCHPRKKGVKTGPLPTRQVATPAARVQLQHEQRRAAPALASGCPQRVAAPRWARACTTQGAYRRRVALRCSGGRAPEGRQNCLLKFLSARCYVGLRFVLQRIISVANHGEMALFFAGKFFKNSPSLRILNFIRIIAEKLV
jgi:hypothetical protein